jgi:hypothetical protein
MASQSALANEIRRFEKQRNLLVVLAACALLSITFAVPQRVAVYREHRSLNARLIELQASIVANQKHAIEVQSEIANDQREIEKRLAR